jgi:hypothetical protein
MTSCQSCSKKTLEVAHFKFMGVQVDGEESSFNLNI